jgi:hypothetical protein
MTRLAACQLILLTALPLAAAPSAAGGAGGAANLRPETLAAFDRYVAAVEARMDEAYRTGRGFLALDAIPAGRRAALERALRAGEFHIERIEPTIGQTEIDVPDGIVHHWLGLVFVPGATVEQAVSLLQDYDRHDEIYAPAVARSRLLARDGDRFRLFLRFVKRKVITVTIDSEHEAVYTRVPDGRVASRVRSTRTHEVEDADTPRERQLPEGEGHGFLWRLNSYWRFVPATGGVWVQSESITLTRDIPFGLRWIVGPFVTSVPRETLVFTLDTTRRTLAR